MNSVAVPNRPTFPVSQPATPPSYTISTVVPYIDANGNSYPALIQTTTHSGPIDIAAQSAQMTANFQAEQDNARVNKAYLAQDAMAEVCMVKRGWQKVLATQ